MSILKQVIKYTNANAIEATWVDHTQLPGEEIQEINVKVTAYDDTQMDLFRADVEAYGGDISQYEELIAEIEAGHIDFAPLP